MPPEDGTRSVLCVQPRGGRYASCAVFGISLPPLALAGCLLLATGAAAQSTTPSSSAGNHPATRQAKTQSTTPAIKHASPIHTHHRHRRKEQAAAPIAPPPPPPLPPVDQAAHPATITYSNDSLRIDADNSSLIQILNQVSRETGLQVEGLNADERIYGQYGPGPVTGTLAKLLDGAGYNYVIVGGAPGKPAAKLMLTGSPSGDTAANDVTTPAPSFNSSPATSTPSNPSEPARPKTPQEIFNELRRMHPQ